jgi:hypothetical protein
MGLILPTRCGCAIRSTTLDINGRGTAESPFTIDPLLAAFVGNFYDFASAAERTTNLPSPGEGDLTYLRDTDRYEIRSGSAWVRFNAWSSTAGRTGLVIRRAAAQSVNSGTLAPISWDTEDFDSDGFIAVTATTITVPAGLGGLYSISALAAFAVNARAQIVTPDFTFDVTAGGVGSTPCPTTLIELSAGDTVVVNVQQASGVAQNFTARCEMYRIGP